MTTSQATWNEKFSVALATSNDAVLDEKMSLSKKQKCLKMFAKTFVR